MVTIYIDSLFLINLFMDTVLLLISNFLLKRCVKTAKLMFGAMFLSLYGCLMFFENISFLYSVFFKIAVTVIDVFFVFGKKQIIKNVIIFWLVSAMCGGIVFALSVMTDFGRIMQASVSNLIIYLNINPLLLSFSCILLYVFAEVYRRVCIKSFSKDNYIIDVSFTYMGREYTVKTLIDTGCSLTEPLSGAPLLIVSKKNVPDIVPTGSKVKSKSVGGYTELDLILPEKILSDNSKFELYTGTLVALSVNNIGEDNLYEAVINPDAIIDNSENTTKLCKERIGINE